jgi:rod shape-determining protein MreD
MIRSILWALGVLALLLLLQTTVLSSLVFWGIKANFLLIVFIVLATQNGSFASQIVGFCLGLVMDMVTTAPLGFHAFLYSLAGYLFGLGSGKVYFDPLAMPAFLGVLATVFDVVVRYLLSTVFRLGDPLSAFFNFGLLAQLVLNMVLAPLVFWLSAWLKDRFQDPRRGFGG